VSGFHRPGDGDLLGLVFLDEDRHLRIAHVPLFEQARDQGFELALGQPRDVQPAEQRQRDRAVVGDAHGLIELLEVEHLELEEVLAPDPVVGAAALQKGRLRLHRVRR
jgi:hypothetical protein